MEFENERDREQVQSRMSSIFKSNKKEESKEKIEKWLMFGILPQEFRNSSMNPYRGKIFMKDPKDSSKVKEQDE